MDAGPDHEVGPAGELFLEAGYHVVILQVVGRVADQARQADGPRQMGVRGASQPVQQEPEVFGHRRFEDAAHPSLHGRNPASGQRGDDRVGIGVSPHDDRDVAGLDRRHLAPDGHGGPGEEAGDLVGQVL